MPERTQTLADRFQARMGEFVAAIFLVMFIFGLLTFAAYFGFGFVFPDIRDTKLALGLLAFATSGAAGFAATWRFMVIQARAQASEQPAPLPPGSSTDELTSDERDFRDQTGYLPMTDNREADRWRRSL